MKLSIGKTVLILTLITSIGLSFASTARAAHATNFLDNLQGEVTNRLANTNLAAAERRALTSANKSLSRNTKTLAADLGALASAARALNAQFTNDTTLANLESAALLAYESEAHAQLEGAVDALGTNAVSKGLSNQLLKAQAALDRADLTTNDVPARARAFAAAFNKMRRPVAAVLANFTAPSTLGGLFLRENAIVNEQTNYDFDFNPGNGFRDYHADDPEELGTWTYQRTGPKTGVLNLAPDFPPGNSGPHTMNLTFTTPRSGTFTGQTIGTAIRPAENLVGTFTVD